MVYGVDEDWAACSVWGLRGHFWYGPGYSPQLASICWGVNNQTLHHVSLHKLSLILLLSLCGASVFSQPGNPDAVDASPVPLSGAEYLLIAGAGLGMFGYLQRRRKPGSTDPKRREMA